MGQQPISQPPGTHQILALFSSAGIQTLAQISQWEVHSHTQKGCFPHILADAEISLKNLKNYLHGIPPSKRYLVDEFRWDPSGTVYTIKAYYHQICINEYPMEIWAHWRLVWKAETLPKIKFFLWILLRGKVVTVENLRKRGIIGPSGCPNCQNEEETIQHLFIDCSFASACWKEAFQSHNPPWVPGTSIFEVLHIWKKSYPRGRKAINTARRVQNALPCTLLWNIWLARNIMIFKGTETNVRKLYNKAQNLNLETLSTKCHGNLKVLDLTVEEMNYIGNIMDRSSIEQKICDPNSRDSPRCSWKIMMKDEEFARWLRNNNTHYLFFLWILQIQPRNGWGWGFYLQQ